MKILLSFLAIGFISSASFASAGFKNGNNIGVVYLSGSVNYFCSNYSGHPENTHHTCTGYIATPGTYDVFTVSTPVDGDKVVLTATHEDGSTRTKDEKFNGTQSTRSLNLLVSTLFQRPLLKMGINNVSYQIFKGKQAVAQGTFVATVKDEGDRVCRPITLTSPTDDNCKNVSVGCDNYFASENYCQY